MILSLLVPALLAQSGLDLPLAGFLQTRDGWYELYGVGANFLTGAKLEDGVLSAASFEKGRAWKTAGELVVHAGETTDRLAAPGTEAWFAWNGSALFALTAGSLYCWKPSEGWHTLGALASEGETLGFSAGPDAVLILTGHSLVRYRTDGTFVEKRPRDGTGPATLDTRGSVWTWSGTLLANGDHTWTFPEAITAVRPLEDGSMIVTHGGGQSLVRPHSPETALLPAP